jgi:hypothetical protein
MESNVGAGRGLANNPVVVRVGADPDPVDFFFDLRSMCPLIVADAHRPKISDLAYVGHDKPSPQLRELLRREVLGPSCASSMVANLRSHTSRVKSHPVGSPCQGQEVRRCREGKRKHSLKLNERTGNVYESKGPLWKTLPPSGNMNENKGI